VNNVADLRDETYTRRESLEGSSIIRGNSAVDFHASNASKIFLADQTTARRENVFAVWRERASDSCRTSGRPSGARREASRRRGRRRACRRYAASRRKWPVCQQVADKLNSGRALPGRRKAPRRLRVYAGRRRGPPTASASPPPPRARFIGLLARAPFGPRRADPPLVPRLFSRA